MKIGDLVEITKGFEDYSSKDLSRGVTWDQELLGHLIGEKGVIKEVFDISTKEGLISTAMIELSDGKTWGFPESSVKVIKSA